VDRVSEWGGIMAAIQKIQVGLILAGKTVTVTAVLRTTSRGVYCYRACISQRRQPTGKDERWSRAGCQKTAKRGWGR